MFQHLEKKEPHLLIGNISTLFTYLKVHNSIIMIFIMGTIGTIEFITNI